MKACSCNAWAGFKETSINVDLLLKQPLRLATGFLPRRRLSFLEWQLLQEHLVFFQNEPAFPPKLVLCQAVISFLGFQGLSRYPAQGIKSWGMLIGCKRLESLLTVLKLPASLALRQPGLRFFSFFLLCPFDAMTAVSNVAGCRELNLNPLSCGKEEGISGKVGMVSYNRGRAVSAIPRVRGLQKPRGGKSQSCCLRAKTQSDK